MAKRLPKSGKITIILGPSEVQAILEDGDSCYYSKSKTIGKKLLRAVSEKFSSVKEDMAEEQRARQIMYGLRDSDAWNTIFAGFCAERQALRNSDMELSRKEIVAMEQLVQKAFDEAGITNFKARGYGYQRV